MRYRFGDCELDTSRFELRRDGERIAAQPQVFQLLVYLIERRDQVVTRDELNKAIWKRRNVTDGALNARVKSARQLVGDDGRTQSVIETVHGTGYRFVADVEAVAVPSLGRGRREPVPGIDLGAELGGLPQIDLSEPRQPSLVVLPFQIIGDPSELDVTAQGLTQDVITRLARTRLLFVIARGTAFKFGAGPYDVREVGAALGVRYVVQGSLQRLGRRLRVNASLASTATRQEIWSEQYNYAYDDLMRVQEELAALIVGTLQSEVERREQRHSLLIPSASLDAWSACHRGFWHMYKFRVEDCDLAERHFRRSIELEPTVPRPYAGLSFIHFQRAFLNVAADRNGAIQQAFEYALQSLQIDPLDPMGHWALSRAHLLRAEHDSAKTALENAIDLNPSYAIAQYSLGWIGLQIGENELCLEKVGTARRLSPYDPLAFAMVGVTALSLAVMGRTREAAGLSMKCTQLPNAHHQALAFAVVCHALDGQRDQARALLRRVRAQWPGYDAPEFLTTFPFKRRADIELVRNAFSSLRAVN